MLRFDLSGIRDRQDASALLLSISEILACVSVAQNESLCGTRDGFIELYGVEPEDAHFGAAKVINACALAIAYIVTEDKLEEEGAQPLPPTN